MAANVVDLIDAVVTRLNAATFTTSITATKKLFPHNNLEDADTVAVQVYSPAESWERQSRDNKYLRSYDVGVLIRVKPANDGSTDIEPYLLLAEEIKDDLVTRRLDNKWIDEIEQDNTIDFEALQNNGLIQINIILRYRGFA